MNTSQLLFNGKNCNQVLDSLLEVIASEKLFNSTLRNSSCVVLCCKYGIESLVLMERMQIMKNIFPFVMYLRKTRKTSKKSLYYNFVAINKMVKNKRKNTDTQKMRMYTYILFTEHPFHTLSLLHLLLLFLIRLPIHLLIQLLLYFLFSLFCFITILFKFFQIYKSS